VREARALAAVPKAEHRKREAELREDEDRHQACPLRRVPGEARKTISRNGTPEQLVGSIVDRTSEEQSYRCV
jgi:hypothetical protein